MLQDNYIKMCDTPEIQDEWEPKVGDWTDRGVITGEPIIAGRYYFADGIRQFVEFIWLPTIGQLMGMVDPVFKKMRWSLDEMYHAFYEYTFDAGTATQWDKLNKRSHQELWLAFMLWELHQVKWDGNKWVKHS